MSSILKARSAKVWGLALVGVLGLSAGSAKAALTLTLNEPGFAQGTGTVSGNSVTFTGTYGDFTTAIDIGVTNSATPGVQATLQLISLEVVSNTPTTPGAKSLTISLTDTGYTAPGTTGQPLVLDSSLGGSLVSPMSTDSVKFTATATPNGGSPATNGQQTFTPVTASGTSSFNIPGGTAPFTATATGFAINETVVLTLSAPLESANLSGSATVSAAPVPEPVSGSIAVVAAMGLTARRRRSAV